ncbi:MAG: hypothetical protein GTN40_02775 [Candidatus Aenigmarchaeota archaeon]|nr:hypothetical protein [Candidatus Aenigmarchaeota archaeon]
MAEQKRFRIHSVSCKNGDLILTVDDPSDYFCDITVSPKQMGKLKEKYGVRWDGTEESVKDLKGKIIEYRIENREIVII